MLTSDESTVEPSNTVSWYSSGKNVLPYFVLSKLEGFESLLGLEIEILLKDEFGGSEIKEQTSTVFERYPQLTTKDLIFTLSCTVSKRVRKRVQAQLGNAPLKLRSNLDELVHVNLLQYARMFLDRISAVGSSSAAGAASILRGSVGLLSSGLPALTAALSGTMDGLWGTPGGARLRQELLRLQTVARQQQEGIEDPDADSQSNGEGHDSLVLQELALALRTVVLPALLSWASSGKTLPQNHENKASADGSYTSSPEPTPWSPLASGSSRRGGEAAQTLCCGLPVSYSTGKQGSQHDPTDSLTVHRCCDNCEVALAAIRCDDCDEGFCDICSHFVHYGGINTAETTASPRVLPAPPSCVCACLFFMLTGVLASVCWRLVCISWTPPLLFPWWQGSGRLICFSASKPPLPHCRRRHGTLPTGAL
jgi:hypothetical protein